MTPDYLQIAKEQFVNLLISYFKAEHGSGTHDYYYNQSCAIKNLLEKFGLDHMDIEVLEQIARAAK